MYKLTLFMSKSILTLFLSFLCLGLFAQEQDFVKEMTGNYIQIRQKPNTEVLLKKWLNTIPLEEDTIYAILYVPMDCYRCEAAIPNFWEMLKQVDAHQKMLLITAYSDSLLAKDYNQRRRYDADAYLYDTTEYYKQIFNTNMAGGLMGLHVLKIDRKRGNLLVGGQYTMLNKLFVRQLIACQGMMEKTHLSNETTENDDSYTEIPKHIQPFKDYNDYEIDPSAKISTIYGIPRFIGNNLFFTDVLQNGVMLFKKEDNKMTYRGLLQVDSIERKKCIKVPETIYQHFVNKKMVFHIALAPNLLDDNHIGISYSIPRIVPGDEEDSYGMYNASVIVSRNIDTLAPDSMLFLNFDIEHDTVFFNTHFSFTKHKDKIMIGCKKLTWPMEYEREEYENIPEMNPFDQRFYQGDNPFIAVFNEKDGNLFKRYGQLDASLSASRTGYYFMNAVTASYGDEFLYTNGYTGKVSIVDSDGQTEKNYQIFNIDTSAFPRPDTMMFYTYEYVKQYTKFFNRCITDIRFDKNRIYCIVKYAKPDSDEGARYVFAIVDRKSRTVQEYAIPKISETIVGCGLMYAYENVSPFVVIKDESSAKVRIYYTNK